MNRIFTFLGLLFAVFAVRAQEPEATPKPKNNSFYLSTDLNVGNYIGLDAGLHYVFNDKFTLGVGFSRHLRVSRSRPSDFGTGLNFEELPIDYIYTYRIHGGPVFKLNESGRLRLNANVGVGYSFIKEPENFRWRDYFIILGPNYEWSYKKTDAVSVVISPRFEYRFKWFFGVSITPTVVLSDKANFYGIGIGSMIGKLGSREKR